MTPSIQIPSPNSSPYGERVSSRSRTYGVCLALLGVAAAAPDGCLLRTMQNGGIPDLVIFCWKFVFAAAIQFFFVLYGSSGPPSLRCLCGCWRWVAVAALCTTGAALNTISNLETTSVSALLFFYVAPLWALVMGVLLLREALQRRTVVAVAVALFGVALLFVPSVLGAGAAHKRPDATHHAASFRGDVLGLLSGLAMAGYLTTCRHASLFKPEAPMVLGVALGSLIAAVIGAYLCLRAGHPLLDVPYRMWPLLLVDCLGIGLYGILSALATNYLPGAEVAFLLLIDVIVAPLLVCMVHGEVPSAAGSSGAALLAAAVIGHEFAALRDRKRAAYQVGVSLTPPSVHRSHKARVSDANLAGLMPSRDDSIPATPCTIGEADGAAETDQLLLTRSTLADDGASDGEASLGSAIPPSQPSSPTTPIKRVSWANA